MPESYPALLITKLYMPRLRAGHVSRPHISALLESGLDKKLTLVAASAGFGKTTAVVDWCDHHSTEVCWLSLDESDNDPIRFFSYLIAALRTRIPLAKETLAALQSPQPPPLDFALYSLVNQLADLRDRAILVLDDYHVIENQAIHSGFAFLLDHLPPALHIVLLTRSDPPLPLARLRARRDLQEIRASTLRFSPEESAQFLNQAMHLDLSPDSIRALESRTEGWIAGLQLAALAIGTSQSVQDQEKFVRGFTGSHRFVLDYLVEEVLSRQPESIRGFLLQTAMLRRLNGDLSDAVTGQKGGQAMLEYLERQNLFLIPLDEARSWYRYHHLFADLLQARLQIEYADLLPDLTRRAAIWHEQHGFAEDAVVYALAARDYPYAARLITGNAQNAIQRGEVNTLLGWYQAFPTEFVRGQPRLCLHFGLAFALNGRWAEAETLLEYVERQRDDARPDETLMLAYLVASHRQDGSRLEAIAREAAEPSRRDPMTRLILALIVSLGGDLKAACALMAEARAMSEQAGDQVLAQSALFHLCRLSVYYGDLKTAYDLSQKALHLAESQGMRDIPMLTFAHVSLTRILIEWNRLDSAADHATQAIRLAELTGFVTGMLSSATMMLAEIRQRQGDRDEALQVAGQAIVLAERYDPPSEVEWLRAYQARIHLNQGALTPAVEWLRRDRERQLPPSMFYPITIREVTRARVLLSQRKLDAAIRILTALIAGAQDLLTVEAMALLALARQMQGDSVHALLMLEQALIQGVAAERSRAFLDLGQPMARLLSRFLEAHASDQPAYAFARQLLDLFPTDPDAAQPVEPLGEREREILRLIAAGLSNDEIAQRLTLAPSTVKWYINTLYGKLRVKTRGQAIARAHELGLAH